MIFFFHCDTQYDTDQTAVGTVHMITILTVQPLSADDGRESGERYSASYTSSYCFEILRAIVLYMFRFKPTHCYATVHTSVRIGIARGLCLVSF